MARRKKKEDPGQGSLFREHRTPWETVDFTYGEPEEKVEGETFPHPDFTQASHQAVDSAEEGDGGAVEGCPMCELYGPAGCPRHGARFR